MFYTSFAEKYFSNVPWDYHEHRLFGVKDGNWKKVLEYISKNVSSNDSLIERIDFNSDRWQLTGTISPAGAREDVILFDDFPYELKTYMKFFTLYSLGEKKQKAGTVKSKVHNFRRVWNVMSKQTNINRIEEVDDGMLYSFFDSYDVGASQLRCMYQSCYDVLSFISKDFSISLNINLADLARKKNAVTKRAADASEKTPPIPDELYGILINKYCEVMRDPTVDKDDRLLAALMVVESQTAFRATDLFPIKIPDITTNHVAVNGVDTEMHYIHYLNHKATRYASPIECDVYCSGLCYEAISIILELRYPTIRGCKTDYLFVNSYLSKKGKSNQCMTDVYFQRQHKRFLVKYLGKVIEKDWEGVTKDRFHWTSTLREQQGIKTEMLSYPTLPQFRVTLATNLYEQGVPLKVIQMTLGHLSNTMQGYYCRPKNDIAEDLAAAHVVLNAISEDALPMLPATGKGDGRLLESIKSFISENHVDVRGDIRKVMDEFGGRLSIRAKLGGYCIKGSLLDCAEDANTNEYLCMYGLCPNIRHFFFNAAASYDDFKRTIATYEHADRHNHKKDKLREARKIKAILENRLLPELDELEKAISEHGKDIVYTKYPSVVYVADNIDFIRKEASEWINRE